MGCDADRCGTDGRMIENRIDVMRDESAIRLVLDFWAKNTREGNLDVVLKNHASDLLIYDVLPPMKYESPAAYRASWGDWQPTTVGENIFELQDLKITAGSD